MRYGGRGGADLRSIRRTQGTRSRGDHASFKRCPSRRTAISEVAGSGGWQFRTMPVSAEGNFGGCQFRQMAVSEDGSLGGASFGRWQTEAIPLRMMAGSQSGSLRGGRFQAMRRGRQIFCPFRDALICVREAKNSRLSGGRRASRWAELSRLGGDQKSAGGDHGPIRLDLCPSSDVQTSFIG